MIDGPDATTTIAGYRLVRQLGSGSRADVYLGAGEASSVALKVFREEVPGESIAAEVEALHRVDSPHVTRLLDVGGDDRGRPILALERVQRGSVAAILRERHTFEAGEVVTIVAPIAHELPALHATGVAHRGIHATNLHLGSNGEPVLLGFGHVELFARGASIAALEAHPGATADREALAALTTGLLTAVRTSGPGHDAVAEFTEWLAATPRGVDFAARLEARLFEFADPAPIDLGRERGESPKLPQRLWATGWPSESDQPGRTDPAMPAPVPGQLAPPGGLVGILHELLVENPVEVAKRRLAALVKGVRKPVWAMAGAVLLALILVIALLPDGSGTRTPKISTAPSPLSAAATPTALPDDPARALVILLRERNRCVHTRSVACLADVDEASSGAWDDDSDLIEESEGGSELPKSALITSSAPILTELLGDTAVLRLDPSGVGQPATVLLIKDPAGWRIRSYFSGVPSTGTSSQVD